MFTSPLPGKNLQTGDLFHCSVKVEYAWVEPPFDSSSQWLIAGWTASAVHCKTLAMWNLCWGARYLFHPLFPGYNWTCYLAIFLHLRLLWDNLRRRISIRYQVFTLRISNFFTSFCPMPEDQLFSSNDCLLSCIFSLKNRSGLFCWISAKSQLLFFPDVSLNFWRKGTIVGFLDPKRFLAWIWMFFYHYSVFLRKYWKWFIVPKEILRSLVSFVLVLNTDVSNCHQVVVLWVASL